jgi:hypothetical protein
MTHRIFRLERITNTNPALMNTARQPLGPVTRLMGWIKTEVFPRYELVEQVPGAVGQVRAFSRRTSPRPQLRVVVVQDGQDSRQHSSRMVISGRMADVCAELDRLAA